MASQETKQIKYKAGYKYQLAEDYSVGVGVLGYEVITDLISLSSGGMLDISRGYAWDGPSGPTFDTKSFMRGSLVHDALYQLIRMNELLMSERLQADIELRRICREDGMNFIRAWYVYRAVRIFGKWTSRPQDARKIQTAP